MVKATNAGGLTQSMADLAIGETAPKLDFSTITNYHDKIQSAVSMVSIRLSETRNMFSIILKYNKVQVEDIYEL